MARHAVNFFSSNVWFEVLSFAMREARFLSNRGEGGRKNFGLDGEKGKGSKFEVRMFAKRVARSFFVRWSSSGVEMEKPHPPKKIIFQPPINFYPTINFFLWFLVRSSSGGHSACRNESR